MRTNALKPRICNSQRSGLFVTLEKSPIKQFGLHREERLKKRKAIDALFTGGKSFGAYPFRVYYRQAGEAETMGCKPGQPLQFGVGVSKRNFKKAVHRNRIKRLTREAYRTQKELIRAKLPAGKHLQVFFIYTGKELPAYDLVRKKVGDALLRLQKETNDHA